MAKRKAKKAKKVTKKKELKKKKTKIPKRVRDDKKKKALKSEERTLNLESREIWKKNVVLALILLLVLALNGWLYFREKSPGNKGNAAPPIKENPEPVAVSVENTNDNVVPQDEMDGLNEQERKIIQELMDKQEMESWKTYKNTAYSFILKYPSDWPEPVVIKPEDGQKYKYKVSFRNGAANEENQKGFDVAIYKLLSLKSGTQPTYSDSLVLKETAAEDYGNCNGIEGTNVGPNEYPALAIKVLKDDPCFSEAYFLSLRKGLYVYDIVPIPEGGISYPGYDGEQKTKGTLPEFEKTVSTFSFIKTMGARTVAVRRISAPLPTGKTKRTGGKRVCAKSNGGHPEKSGKGKHMDEDCCMDPDETPNPWCAY